MSSEDEEETGSIWDGNETVWHAWVPECDACGRAEASLTGKGVFLTCAGCIVAKYCTKECQKQDRSNGHKNLCHLYEANRKLSSAFAKSLGPGVLLLQREASNAAARSYEWKNGAPPSKAVKTQMADRQDDKRFNS
ncbi:hypothetical protein C8R47DRAFT_1219709 [Mycena vitilis]|nr:hypothetical protein C8R47DRAFT_1219709 [Mycena vitilis]